jgi:uncharacterized protein
MPTFRILSLDGGGIRGVATAAFLGSIERNLGHRVADHFDLIAGTSTGGIIAAGLALGRSAEDIEQFYSDWGRRIFKRGSGVKARMKMRVGYRILRMFVSAPSISDIDAQWIVGPRYEVRVLSEALHSVFGDQILNQAKRRVIIPAVDLIKGQTVVFRTPHLPGMVRDRWLRVDAIALATASAPTYFQPTTITKGSLYADGGLWANNPAMVAFTEAARISRECKRNVDPSFSIEDVRILSLGTGLLPYYLNPADEPAGIAYWAPRILDVVGAAQSQGIDFQVGFLAGPGHYRRINFPLPDRSFALDSTDHLDVLTHKGRECATEWFSAIRSEFLSERADAYVPFD